MNWAQILGFEQWAPDADPTRQGTITDLLNFIPSERGWRSAYSLADAGVSSMSSTCCGAFLMQKLDGTNLVFAGTASTLLLNVGYTWTVICSDSYHASESQRWRWATMGDYVLAATQSDTIAVSNAGATFTSITGAPKARMIESVYGFVMAAGTIDATYGEQSDRWYCSAIFDHTSWTPSAITQCTTGRLVDTPGPITG
ncbi:MAG: hypothetical protein NHG36_07920, partial [Chromatiaceae bacterium]|nr:hypothetical protein [Candidatus Thioaporhodococcus sediminis]